MVAEAGGRLRMTAGLALHAPRHRAVKKRLLKLKNVRVPFRIAARM
jgi:hypothetical protein